MNLRQRTHDETRTVPPPGSGGPADALLGAERLLAAGADAIDRALSQDSAAFLSANRQEGGE
jgi:hypothetical protein